MPVVLHGEANNASMEESFSGMSGIRFSGAYAAPDDMARPASGLCP